MKKPQKQPDASPKPTVSAFDLRRLTRLAAYNLIRKWMFDGCPMAAAVSADEDEVWHILQRILNKKLGRMNKNQDGTVTSNNQADPGSGEQPKL